MKASASAISAVLKLASVPGAPRRPLQQHRCDCTEPACGAGRCSQQEAQDAGQQGVGNPEPSPNGKLPQTGAPSATAVKQIDRPAGRRRASAGKDHRPAALVVWIECQPDEFPQALRLIRFYTVQEAGCGVLHLMRRCPACFCYHRR